MFAYNGRAAVYITQAKNLGLQKLKLIIARVPSILQEVVFVKICIDYMQISKTILRKINMPQLITMVCLLITVGCSNNEQPGTPVSPESDFQYIVNSDNNTVTCTKYIGKGGEVVIPAELGGKPVGAIGNIFEETGAFEDCTDVTSVIIPEGVTVIEDNAFRNCVGLTSVAIPSSITLLRNCAFDNCPNLRSVYFEGDAPETANYVFTATSILTIYYRESSSGWTNPWYGCPTETYNSIEGINKKNL